VRSFRRTRRPLLALLALVVALAVGYGVKGADSGSGNGNSAAPSASISAGADGVPLSSLPAQAAQTVALIRSGGPFPYPHNDGVVFHNYEHTLPSETDGYYHEYTVPTPGSDDRGARRIITGKNGEFYYTGNHYDSFTRIDVGR
jgi:ribonuclease T1